MKNIDKKTVYLDNAATTNLCEAAYNKMLPFLSLYYGNPSANYDIAKWNKKVIEECRKRIALLIGAKAEEIIFTSGGSESDNIILKGVYYYKIFNDKKRTKYNIVTSMIEHKAILKTCEFLSKLGVEIRYVKNDNKGVVDLEDLERKIDNNTILCSIMFVNNELGTIEPIKKIAKICKLHNVLFHTDAVQAIGHLKINVKKLGIDFLSASAHKFNGPKGIGFIYKRQNLNLESLINGGSQEQGLRAGTENVASIIGMSEALNYNLLNIDNHIKYVTNLMNYLISKLNLLKEKNNRFEFIYNCGGKDRIYSHLNISFKNLYAENILNLLNLKRICVSSGSACNSKENVISHVLSAIKCPKDYINGAIRISLSYENTKEEIDYFIIKLEKIINLLKK